MRPVSTLEVDDEALLLLACGSSASRERHMTSSVPSASARTVDSDQPFNSYSATEGTCREPRTWELELMMRARAKRRAVLHAAWSATAERVGSLSA
jgi:hypothetical protein